MVGGPGYLMEGCSIPNLIIALATKMYYFFGNKDQFSSNGTNKKQKEITKQRYLEGDHTQEFTNKGFRGKSNEMTTVVIDI